MEVVNYILSQGTVHDMENIYLLLEQKFAVHLHPQLRQLLPQLRQV